MAFWEHQQAAGSFAHRVIKRGNQTTHHRAAVNKTKVVVDRRAARQRQRTPPCDMPIERHGQRLATGRAVYGQRDE